MKRGFTLIELLAVILILGIIALIAIPTVNSILKESRKGAFQSTVNNVDRKIQETCNIQKIKNTELTRIYNFNDGDVDNELDIKGQLPNDGNVVLNNSCETSFKLGNDNFCAIKDSYDDDIIITDGKCDYTEYFADTLIKNHSETVLKIDTYETNLLKPDSKTKLYHEKKSKHPYVSKRYFVGENPDNLLLFANSCWSIMNITQNNSVKIIYEGPANGNTCTDVRTLASGKIDMSNNLELNRWAKYDDEELECGWSNWNDEGTVIRKYLEQNNFIPFTNEELAKIADATWYTGFVTGSYNFDDKIYDDLKHERIGDATYLDNIVDYTSNGTDYYYSMPSYKTLDELGVEEYTYTGKFALFSPTDYLKINCLHSANISEDNVCSANNYMKKTYDYWSINVSNWAGGAWHYQYTRAMNVNCVDTIDSRYQPSFRVAAYINNKQIVESGDGSSANPYILR